MSYRTLIARADIRNARRELAERLKAELPVVARRSIGYPHGHIANAVARFEQAGALDSLWWHRFLSENGGVDVNLFGINDTRQGGNMNIGFQFNYPLDGAARAQGGVFVDDGNGIVLAHRGIMTKGSRVKREPLLRQLGHRAIQVEDDGAVSDVLLIAPLGSASLVQDLKAFSHEAREAVSRVARGMSTPMRGTPATTFKLPSGNLRSYFDEFFGPRSTGGGRRSGSTVAQCHHGAIVKALEAEFSGKCVKSGQVDLAFERDRELVLFEVKTSTSSQDVYTGLGQLLFHGEAQRRPGQPIVRCLVLPQMPEPQAARRVNAALDVRFVAYQREADGAYRFDGLAGL